MNDLLLIGKKYLSIGSTGHNELVEYYNTHCFPLVAPDRRYRMSMKDNWCAMFTSVIAHKAGYRGDSFPFEVSVYYQYLLAKKRGMTDDSPRFLRPGDLVVYNWGTGAGYDHVGFVETATDDLLTVLEGNYSGTVGIRRVARSSKALQAFILIDRQVAKTSSNDLYTLVHEVLRGEHGNGEQRKKSLGDNYEKVQEIINSMG